MTSAWRSGWPMPHGRVPRQSSPLSRCARLSPWPARSRQTPADRSANGVTVNWQMRSCGGASSSRSRRGMPGGCSKEADLKPHLIRYWLTPAADEPPEVRDEKIADVCGTYREAQARVARGERVISTDEMTGVQALERAAPGLPLRPGKVERRQFDYTPQHACWVNQVDLWLSIVVVKLLRPGDYTSIDDLRNKVLEFIAYFNRTMAKPFKWTYLGKPLHA